MANQIINNDNLTVTAQPFGAEACPSTPAELHSLFGSYTSVTNKGAAIVSSETEPTSSDHDKLWLRVDSSGDPFALYFRNVTNSRWEPANGVPIGSVQIFAGATAPSGWVDCDGASYDGAAAPYDMLFDVIGATYNTGGEAAGHFSVPDFMGRVPVGAGTGSTGTARTIADTGGTESHVLTVDELPPHTRKHAAIHRSCVYDSLYVRM